MDSCNGTLSAADANEACARVAVNVTSAQTSELDDELDDDNNEDGGDDDDERLVKPTRADYCEFGEDMIPIRTLSIT